MNLNVILGLRFCVGHLPSENPSVATLSLPARSFFFFPLEPREKQQQPVTRKNKKKSIIKHKKGEKNESALLDNRAKWLHEGEKFR